mmetsp:Transcript_115942/g.334818  ORF Transcript_115942/g.334818 Transcript_115942/m.334818 type:complete len:237 (-) Transcript_115942:232-942(-)
MADALRLSRHVLREAPRTRRLPIHNAGPPGLVLAAMGLAAVRLNTGHEDFELAVLDDVEIIRNQVAFLDEFLSCSYALLPSDIHQLLYPNLIQAHHGLQVLVHMQSLCDQRPLLIGLWRRRLGLGNPLASATDCLPVCELQLLMQTQLLELFPCDLQGLQGGVCGNRREAGLVAEERVLPKVIAHLQRGHLLRGPMAFSDGDTGLAAADDEELCPDIALLDDYLAGLEVVRHALSS